MCLPLTMRANGGLRHLLRGSTNRLFFCFPQLPSSTLPSSPPAHNQLIVRETPLGMSEKHIFEMTRSFHVLACHKACERAVCRLRQGRVKDLQWPKAPGSLPNKLPVALNLQHNTTHHTTPQHTTHCCSHVYTQTCTSVSFK